MIDERINQSLMQLEAQLKDVKSAREQVESTVNSFDGLKSTTSSYVTSLKNIETKLTEIVSLVGNDYKSKVNEFEKGQDAIVKSCNEAIDKVKNTAYKIKKDVSLNIKSIQDKLKYILIANLAIFVALIIMFFLHR